MMDIIVFKSQDTVTEALEESGSSCIPRFFLAGRVRGAVDLDYKACVTADEIRNVWVYRFLADEFVIFKLSSSQMRPQE